MSESGVPGEDVPDRRGRTGLHRTGLDLHRNPHVRVKEVRLLTSNWYITRANRIELQRPDGSWVETERETYDRGDGACLFLYDEDARSILLVRQFRYPAYVNEHPDGMLLELPAGLLDEDDAQTAIHREVQEEVGLELADVRPVFSLYMSPGSVTERLHFFAGTYRSGDVADGSNAGIADEAEHTEVVEMPFDAALNAIGVEIVDAKTILMVQWAALSGPFASVVNDVPGPLPALG